MRIAVWHNLNSGGGKRALYYHVKGLVERGHEVVSFCPDTVDQQFLPLSDLVKENVYPLKEKLQEKGFFPSKDQVWEKSKAMLQHCEACADDINKGGFDILFANSSSLFYMSHIGRFVNIPKLIYLGEPFRPLYEAMPDLLWKAPKRAPGEKSYKYLLRRLKHLYKMYWYSYLCREEYTSASSYDLILVNSNYSRETVKRCYGLESHICYLGINTDAFSTGTEKKESYIVGLGLVHHSKGIKRAIDTVSLLDAASRPEMIWVGNNTSNFNYVTEIRNYATEKGVTLTIRTFIEDLELVNLLRKASVLLYLPNLEPFGLAPLEANACGTAVVGIQEGGLKETIRNGINGFTASSFSPEEISGLVGKFSDPEFAAQMGNSARQYVVDSWNYSKGIDNIENYMFSLIEMKRKFK